MGSDHGLETLIFSPLCMIKTCYNHKTIKRHLSNKCKYVHPSLEFRKRYIRFTPIRWRYPLLIKLGNEHIYPFSLIASPGGFYVMVNLDMKLDCGTSITMFTGILISLSTYVAFVPE